jgi:hypothetical protein
MRAACPTCLIILPFIILIIFTRKLKLSSLLSYRLLLSLSCAKILSPLAVLKHFQSVFLCLLIPSFSQETASNIKMLFKYLRLYVESGKRIFNFLMTLHFKFSSNMQAK